METNQDFSAIDKTDRMSTMELQIFHRNTLFAMAIGEALGFFPKSWRIRTKNRKSCWTSKPKSVESSHVNKSTKKH